MPNDTPALFTAEDALPAGDTLRQQIEIIEESQKYILLIIIAIALSYGVTNIQKQQLQCTIDGAEADCVCADLPDTFPISLVSSLFVLAAVIFFFLLSCQTARGPHETCAEQEIAQSNSLASLLVLLAAIIRLCNLLKTGRR